MQGADKSRLHPINLMMASNCDPINKFGRYLAYIWKYRNMLFNMVKKDFKGKYRNSMLGYVWHLITPLSMIIVYYIVFNTIFGKDIPNYWLYLSSAIFAFNLFSTSMVNGVNSITGNSGMVTKMLFPREILVISNVIVSLINSFISYLILFVVMLVTGTYLSYNVLYVPLILILESGFATGVGLILGAMNVYVRDVVSGVHIIQMFLMFITPCFYRIGMMDPFLQSIIMFNPLVYFTENMHNVLYYATSPNLMYLGVSTLISLLFLVMGLYIFKKLEKGFAERL